MSWSTQQMAAITSRDQNLLVAAAAGSGKTSVLVERIIQRITDTTAPINIDELLVVTFTSAAAAEMRERIGVALATALKNGTRSPRLERQLLLLNSSSISTLHAFCQSIIRQYFYLLELDPNFRVMSEPEADLLKGDILEKLLEELYEQGDAAFLELIEHYGDDASDDTLYGLILGLHRFSRSHPWPTLWLQQLTGRFALPDGVDMEDTPWAALLLNKAVLALARGLDELQALSQEAVLTGNQPYADIFVQDIAVMQELLACAERGSWQALQTCLSSSSFARAVVGKSVAEEYKKYFSDARQRVKNIVADLRNTIFDRPVEDWFADMRQVAPLIETLGRMVLLFDQRYKAAKTAKALVDFNDLEHFCLDILVDPEAQAGELRPSAVAKQLQDKFKEVMIDEYQDTNGVQETILQLVAKPDNRFMVGDVKQSIYRFRLAEPELFMQKYHQYAVGEQGRRIDLAQNFRSRPGILHAVNFLFMQLMTKGVGELAYGEEERLNPGPDYPDTEQVSLSGPVELHIIDREQQGDIDLEGAVNQDEDEEGDETAQDNSAQLELSAFELEAALVVSKIRELIRKPSHYVFDKNSKTYRRLSYRDIVIIMRSIEGKANVLLDVLRQHDIPAYAELGSGYFAETEVQVMLSLLNVIDNPRQDIHLAGVLRSPLVGLNGAELAEIRLCDTGDLWAALSNCCKQNISEPLKTKVDAFCQQLRSWRSFARRKSVAELISLIYRDTGYYDYVGGMPGGTYRQANLRAMFDRARQFETTNFRGLFRFLRFIDRLRDKGSDLSVARALGESEDVVRVMSIHKSKGLEFPVVFVIDLGKQFNMQDTRQTVLCHKNLGVGPFVIRPAERFRYPTLARIAISHQMQMETKAEELRVLYVALTRAREKLILIGSTGKLAQKAVRWCRTAGRYHVALPDSTIAAANSYLDWICTAVARHPDGEHLRIFAECPEQPNDALLTDPSTWELQFHQRENIEHSVLTAQTRQSSDPMLEQARALQAVPAVMGTTWVDTILGWQYLYQSVGKPAKLAVTEIKRRQELLDRVQSGELTERRPLLTRPLFIQTSANAITAVELGIVMHTIMQHLDLHGELNRTGIRDQLEGMVAREVLLAEHAQQVSLDSIAAFFEGALGKRLCQATTIWREMPFSLALPAERFYPELSGSNETVFVQGVIDCMFEEDDGLVLLDYKNDKANDLAELAEQYKTQLDIYTEAIESILKKKVKEKYLYSFVLGQDVRV